jgi:hypothetical protein
LQPAFLKLRLRPEDPYSHPLFGERAQQAGLLLRIARPKGQPEAAPSVTCVSRVAATYAFNGMADYQVGVLFCLVCSDFVCMRAKGLCWGCCL